MTNSIRFLSPNGDGDDKPENGFLWGYQKHFAMGMLTEAQRIFGHLDRGLVSDLFVVGINLKPDDELPLAVIEPRDHPMTQRDFERVMSLAQESAAATPGPKYAHHLDDPHGKAWVDTSMEKDFRGRLGGVIEQVVCNAYANDDVESFVSPGRTLDSYAIYTVLLLNRSTCERYPILRRSKRKQFSVCTSFVGAVAKEVMDQAWSAIALSFDGQGYPELPTWEAIFRAAANRFMHTPMAATDNVQGLHGGFEACNEISALTYERAVGQSRLLIARKNHPNVEMKIAFTKPVRLRDFRAVRKVLELAGPKEGLVCDSENVLGIGALSGKYDPAAEDLFTVEFVGHAQWELRHTGIPVLRVEHGIPCLPTTAQQAKQVQDTFERIFPDVEESKSQLFLRLANRLHESGHGLVLIVTDDAKEEATRFAKEATGIAATPITSDLIQRASRIDGAMLVTPHGICHAIGVILDGSVSEHGTAERGARFNSTVRYVCSRLCRCFGVVVSDDGTIDLVPKHRPRISRASLHHEIDAFKATVESDIFNERSFCAHRKWFDEHEFYLDSEMCVQVNELLAMGEKRVRKSVISFQSPPLRPHPEMNDTFFR